MMIIDDIRWFSFTLPLDAPLHVAGTVLTQRRGYLLRLTACTGFVAWGEASPFPGNGTAGADAPSRARLTALLHKQPVDSLPFTLLRPYPGPADIARPFLFAAEQALDRLRALRSGLPLHRFLNPRAADTLPLCALLDGSPEAVRQMAARAALRQMTAVKAKVGRTAVHEEAKLLHGLRDVLPLPCRIRLDANRAWDWETAMTFSAAVRDVLPDYLEEPLADPSRLPDFADCSGLPYAVDETLVEVWTRVQPPGMGPVPAWARPALRRASHAIWKPTLIPPPQHRDESNTLPVVLSSAYESGVGTAAILALSAACGGDTLPPGVDTYSRLSQDVLQTRLDLSGPYTTVSTNEARAAAVDETMLEPIPDAC